MQAVALKHFAIITSAVLAFVIGGLWYDPLFGKAWMAESNLTPETPLQMNAGKVYGLAVLWTLVMADNLGFLLGDPSLSVGTTT